MLKEIYSVYKHIYTYNIYHFKRLFNNYKIIVVINASYFIVNLENILRKKRNLCVYGWVMEVHPTDPHNIKVPGSHAAQLEGVAAKCHP